MNSYIFQKEISSMTEGPNNVILNTNSNGVEQNFLKQNT